VLSFQKYHKLQMMMKQVQDKQLKVEKLKQDLTKTKETFGNSIKERVNDQNDEDCGESFEEEEYEPPEEEEVEFCEEEEEEEAHSEEDEEIFYDEEYGSYSSDSEYISESDMEVVDYFDSDEYANSDEDCGDQETEEFDKKQAIDEFEQQQVELQKVPNMHMNGLVDYLSTDDEVSVLNQSDSENNGNEVLENLNEASSVHENLDVTSNIGRHNDSTTVDDFDVEAVMAMQFRDTRLESHIREHGLNLIPREATRNDGNCWYDAIADQILLHEVHDKPNNHLDLRLAVCDALPQLPQAKDWVQNLFGDEKTFDEFIEEHRQPGVWTDGLGIMCQATALYVGRIIHIVGTANIGQGFAFTKLESTEEADSFPPFTVGYYQDRHYQSLQEDLQQQNTDVSVSSDKFIGNIIDKFDEEKLLDESVFENDSDYEAVYVSDLDIDSFDNNFINSDDSVSEMLEKVDIIRGRAKDDSVVETKVVKQSYGKSRNLLDRLC